MTKVSIFQNIYQTESKFTISIAQLFERIRDCKHIELVHKLLNTKDKKERDELKKQLPAVTVSGIFEGGRKLENLVQHTGLIQIDFDNLEENIVDVEKKLQELPYIVMTFLSPSCRGVKAIAHINPDVETHEMQFEALAKELEMKTNFPIDQHCKDVTRLMFESADNQAYFNPKPKMYEGGLPKTEKKSQAQERILKALTQPKKLQKS